MTEVVITALIAPVAILVATLVIDVARKRLGLSGGDSTSEPDTPAPVVGQPIPVDWADRAYQTCVDDLARERAEHAECHTVMRAHGVAQPHD